MCPAFGWLTESTDAERQGRGQCRSTFLGSEPIVILEAQFPLAFACNQVAAEMIFRFDGQRYPKTQLVTCGYVLQGAIQDARGKPLSPAELERIAARTTFADAHKLTNMARP